MRSFTNLLSDFTTISKDSTTANTTLGATLINQFIRKILVARDWTFNRSDYSDASVATQQAYPLPYNCQRIREIKVTPASDINYFPKEITSREIWTNLNRVVVSGDAAQKFFVEPNEVELYPVPSTTGSVIKIYFQKLIKILASANDYATGTVTTTVGSKTVTGVGTTFAATMVGQFITFDDHAYFYEIAGFTSTTVITLKREIGVAVTGGNYDIIDLIPLPYGFEDIPLWRALDIYFKANEDITQAREYERMWKEGLAELLRRDAKSTGNILTKEAIGDIIGGVVDVNMYPQDIS